MCDADGEPDLGPARGLFDPLLLPLGLNLTENSYSAELLPRGEEAKALLCGDAVEKGAHPIRERLYRPSEGAHAGFLQRHENVAD